MVKSLLSSKNEYAFQKMRERMNFVVDYFVKKMRPTLCSLSCWGRCSAWYFSAFDFFISLRSPFFSFLSLCKYNICIYSCKWIVQTVGTIAAILSHFLRWRHTSGNEKMNSWSKFDSCKVCLFPKALFIRLQCLKYCFMLLLAKVTVLLLLLFTKTVFRTHALGCRKANNM